VSSAKSNLKKRREGERLSKQSEITSLVVRGGVEGKNWKDSPEKMRVDGAELKVIECKNPNLSPPNVALAQVELAQMCNGKEGGWLHRGVHVYQLRNGSQKQLIGLAKA